MSSIKEPARIPVPSDKAEQRSFLTKSVILKHALVSRMLYLCTFEIGRFKYIFSELR